MSTYYPPSQPYGSYQGTYPNYPTQAQYPAQFAAQSGSGSTSYPGYPPPSPAPEPISAPEIPAITSEIASQIIQRLISSELHHAGFDTAQPSTVLRLEQEVVACPFIFVDSSLDYTSKFKLQSYKISFGMLMTLQTTAIDPALLLLTCWRHANTTN